MPLDNLNARSKQSTALAAAMLLVTVLATFTMWHPIHPVYAVSFLGAVIIHRISGQAALLAKRPGEPQSVTEIRQLYTMWWFGFLKTLWVSTVVLSVFYAVNFLLVLITDVSAGWASVVAVWAITGQFSYLFSGIYDNNAFRRDVMRRLALMFWTGSAIFALLLAII